MRTPHALGVNDVNVRITTAPEKQTERLGRHQHNDGKIQQHSMMRRERDRYHHKYDDGNTSHALFSDLLYTGETWTARKRDVGLLAFEMR